MANKAHEFKNLLMTDSSLRDRMQEAARAYVGDRNDDRTVFEAVVAPVARSVGMEFSYEEALAAMRDAREMSDEELELVAGGVGIWRRIVSGALVATLAVGSVPAAALAEESAGSGTSVTQQYVDVDGILAEDADGDAVADEDSQGATDDDLLAGQTAEDLASYLALSDEGAPDPDELIPADAQAQLIADLGSASLVAGRKPEQRRAEEAKRARTMKGIEVTGKTALAIGKFAVGVMSMNPGLLFGGAGDGFGVIMSICGLGHGGPSNQDLMDGIDDIKDSLKDIKVDLDEIKQGIKDASLKQDIQYSAKLIDALVTLESDCAGAENLYSAQMLAKIGMSPLPEDATPEQTAAWCEEVGQALKQAKRNKVNGFEYYDYYNKRIREDLTTIYAMLKEGSESNPVDAWRRYWEGTCNFESQAYGPKQWLRAAIECEVMRGYGYVALYTNIPSDPENIEKSTTSEMQEMLLIAEGIDAGVSPEEAAAGAPVWCYALDREAVAQEENVAFADKNSFGASITPDQYQDFRTRLCGRSLKDELVSAGLRSGTQNGYAFGFHVVDAKEGTDSIRFIAWDSVEWGMGQTYGGLAVVFTKYTTGTPFFSGRLADTLPAGRECFQTLALR